MFTGIIEEVGTLAQISQQGNSLQLTIKADAILKDVQVGDSIAVNGVCLTVTGFTDSLFFVDVMPETFHATSLAMLAGNKRVNLERAMLANGRFGGHFVTGHVDGVGTIIHKERVENALLIEIKIPTHGSGYMINRGSIAVDGTSLTIFRLTDETVTISLIPHTAEATILSEKKLGDLVNIEFDLLAKYVQKSLGQTNDKKKEQTKITMEQLKENGFA